VVVAEEPVLQQPKMVDLVAEEPTKLEAFLTQAA
jgi:hypothetical protein